MPLPPDTDHTPLLRFSETPASKLCYANSELESGCRRKPGYGHRLHLKLFILLFLVLGGHLKLVILIVVRKPRFVIRKISSLHGVAGVVRLFGLASLSLTRRSSLLLRWGTITLGAS